MQLFVHAVIIGGTLSASILTFGPVSGAHVNPVVTLVDAAFGGLPWRRVWGYIAAQVVGAVAAALLVRWLFAPSPVEAARVVVPADPAAEHGPAGTRGPTRSNQRVKHGGVPDHAEIH